MFWIGSPTVSLLVMVTVRAALGVPTFNVVLNAIDVGDTVTGVTPVPVRLTVSVPSA